MSNKKLLERMVKDVPSPVPVQLIFGRGPVCDKPGKVDKIAGFGSIARHLPTSRPMKPISADRRLPKPAANWSLGCDRRGRFLLEFDRWRRKFRSLRRSLVQAKMRRCVYYRWKKGQVIPKESALRRYCLQTGIDEQYVLTGIPGKVGNNTLTLWHYQQQHKQATTAHERGCAFRRLVTESANVLDEEVPELFMEGVTAHPKPMAILKYVISELYRFDITIAPLPDGRVGFEVYRVEVGVPLLAVEGPCDEGALFGVRLYLREKIRDHRKKIKNEHVLTSHLLRKEAAWTARHNGRHD